MFIKLIYELVGICCLLQSYRVFSQGQVSKFVPKSSCPRGGVDGFIYNDTSNRMYMKRIPPIVYIKTTKTGSSTIASILHRLADIRDLTVMVPRNFAFLGWPKQFPGEDNGFYKLHSIDMIMNHAIFNREAMHPYMRPTGKPFYFTSIREPYSLQVSAYNFFGNFTFREGITWPLHIDNLRNISTVYEAPEVFFRNPLALDLGWYEHHNGSVAYDYDQGAIDEFIHHLDKNLDLVILLEDFDRGIILLGHYLGVSVNELVSVQMKIRNDGEEAPYYRPDNEDLYKQYIYDINVVDVKLYEYFLAKFNTVWEEESRNVATKKLQDNSIMLLEDRLTLLQSMNKDINDKCGNIEAFHNNNCNQAFIEESMMYGVYLAWQKFTRGTRKCANSNRRRVMSIDYSNRDGNYSAVRKK